MTTEYYNVVINPDGMPIIGVNDTVKKPLPLPEPETENEPIQGQNRIQTIDINIRSVKIRNLYKIFHINMLILTVFYTVLLMQEYITLFDVVLSFVQCLYIFENNENFLKVHTFYLIISFSFTASFNMYDFMGYYFLYSVINVATFMTLMLDRNEYYTEQLRSRLEQDVV